MHPGGVYLYGNDNGNGSGFRYERGQPYRPPVPPEQQQMTPQEREAILMAAGRLAAEYLVNRGDLPPNVLETRPPPPIPSLGAGGQPAFGSQWQYHQQQQPPPLSRPFYFQGRPPAPLHRQHQFHPFHFPGQQPQRRFPGPRPFQGGRGPFPKRPRQQRPSPYGPPGPAPAPPQTRFAAGQAAAPVVAASKSKRDDDKEQEHSAPAGVGQAGGSQPTARPDVQASVTQQTNEPSSSFLGANASESS